MKAMLAKPTAAAAGGPATDVPVESSSKTRVGDARQKKRTKKRGSKRSGARNETATTPETFDPPLWFFDVDRLVATCGMHGHVLPREREVPALFRQHWRDFEVTEMPTWRHVISREPDFTIPQAPAGEHTSSRGLVKSLADLEVKPDEPDVQDELAQSQSLYDTASGGRSSKRPWLQFYLRKQHVAHLAAMQILGKHLKTSPRDITVSGIKDFVGDTVQRVRIRGVPAGALLELNDSLKELMEAKRREAELQQALHFGEYSGDRPLPQFEDVADDYAASVEQHERYGDEALEREFIPLLPDASIVLSDFSYEAAPLKAGHHAGNHFTIVLRDVDCDEATFQRAAESLKTRGFQNFFGSQRFSWFRGLNDPSLALLQGDWARVFFGILDVWESPRSARTLLQRPQQYPLPLQNHFRIAVVRALRECVPQVLPHYLDGMRHFRVCPPPGEFARVVEEGELTRPEPQFVDCIFAAYQQTCENDRITPARFPSFLWNIAVSARFAAFGSKVLVGDFVVRESVRMTLLDGPPGLTDAHVEVVTPENIHEFTIFDVHHPAFSFRGNPLPQNAVAEIYHAVLDVFGLSWQADPTEHGVHNLPGRTLRPVAVLPGDVSAEFNAAQRTATVRFKLPRGSYATVALRELLGSATCVNEPVRTKGTRPDREYDRGAPEPRLVQTMDAVYNVVDFDTGEDTDDAQPDIDSDVSLIDHPENIEVTADPADAARAFSTRNFERALMRRERLELRGLRMHFEDELIEQMTPEEKRKHSNHFVAARPNTSRRDRWAAERKRRKMLRGVAAPLPTIQRKNLINNNMSQGKAKLLSKDTWNIW